MNDNLFTHPKPNTSTFYPTDLERAEAEVGRLTAELADARDRVTLWKSTAEGWRNFAKDAEAREKALRAITGEMLAESKWRSQYEIGFGAACKEWARRAKEVT